MASNEIKKDSHITNAEIVFSTFSMALLGAIVSAAYGRLYLDKKILEAQLEYAQTGNVAGLMELKQSAWDQFTNFGLLGAGLGMIAGLVILAGINAARNSSTERHCPHACTHHHAV